MYETCALQVLEIGGESLISHLQLVLYDQWFVTADFDTGGVACFLHWEISPVCVSAVLVRPEQKLLCNCL